MRIIKASELGESIREKLCELYINSFYEDGLKTFAKDKTKLYKAWNHTFILDNFFVATIEDDIAGMIGFMRKDGYCMKLSLFKFIRYLGLFWGAIAYIMVKKDLKESHKIHEDSLMIEFLGVSENHRKKGVATALFHKIFTELDYQSYVLKVADNNNLAFELYKKLGFIETHRVKFMPSSGISYWIHLKYTK